MNQSTPPTANSPVKILIVDDHPNTATTLARALAQLGPEVEVHSATSGSQALEHVREGAADILITDMMMPEMTGLELIEKLQNHPAGRPTFCFLMTAYDVPGLKVTARRLRVKEVIIKPVPPGRICQIVKGAMTEMNGVGPAYKEPASQKRFTILIADDQPDNLTLLARYLENEGYGFITAKDGLETLEKVLSELPDLVLLDVNMPHKDGFAVLKEIRSDPATQHIPVIILTAARLGPMEIQSGLNMGADDYVTKPFDRRELLARIRTKLRVKEAEDEIRRHNRELSVLPEIGKELGARLDVNELTDVVLHRTVETLGAMTGHIIVLNPKGPIHKEYHISPPASLSKEIQFPPLNDLLDQLKDTRQGLIIDNTQNDPRWQVMADNPALSLTIVPMSGRFDLLGLLILTHEKTGYFKLEHLLMLQAIASQAAIAMENAQLYTGIAHEQQRLSAVVQNAADAILMFDSDGCLSLLNPAAQKLFTDCEAKLGLPLARGCGYDALTELLEETLTYGESKTGEIAWPDHRVFTVLFTPIGEDGCVALLHDISHYKTLERVKNEFISTASHDLKNPIGVIAGFNDLLAKAGPLNETQAGFVHRIHSAAENMNELVQNLLDLAKVDMGLELRKETVNINSQLAEISDEFQPQAKVNRQTIRLQEAGDQIEVRGDALQLRQAVRNLVGNALKYSPPDSPVILSVMADETNVTIRVRDNGYGIPANDLPFIFDRFYRVRSDAVKDIEGNGLGLAIVKSIVEQHDGQVSVESRPGKGSCFTLTLPLAEEK